MLRAVLIDMDDTLYDERAYVLSGFRAVAEAIAGRHPEVDVDGLFADMTAELDARGRGKVFDQALMQAGLTPTPDLIAGLVRVYREHHPRIALWPGVAEALAEIGARCRTAIVTDGLAVMQRRKVEALGLAARVDEVLYCWEHDAAKPAPTCYFEALRRLGARAEEAVVIGDRPDHDMAAARAVGCRSIRVLTGRFARQDDAGFAADATAADFTGVPAILWGEQFGAAA